MGPHVNMLMAGVLFGVFVVCLIVIANFFENICNDCEDCSEADASDPSDEPSKNENNKRRKIHSRAQRAREFSPVRTYRS